MKPTRTVGVPRRAISLAAATGLAAVGVVTLASAFSAQADVMEDGDLVWVCKYIGTPGVDQRPRPNNNPALVGWRLADPDGNGEVSVGETYTDNRGLFSYVVQINGETPGLAACPPGDSGPSPTTTTSTSTGSPTFTSPTTSPTTPPPPSTTTTTTTTTPPTTPPSTTTTTTPPSTTTTTTPPSTTTTTTTTVPPNTSSTPPPPVQTTPGVTPPDTGGAGDASPVNVVAGSALLASAGAVLAGAFRSSRRRGAYLR